jgi:mono/diheme cytochrome c family protein
MKWLLCILMMLPMLSFGSEGQDAYEQRCVPCHSPGNAGWLQLKARNDGLPAELLKRPLNTQLIEQVVRNGLQSMPAISRVELSDQQLAEVITYINTQAQ